MIEIPLLKMWPRHNIFKNEAKAGLTEMQPLTGLVETVMGVIALSFWCEPDTKNV